MFAERLLFLQCDDESPEVAGVHIPDIGVAAEELGEVPHRVGHPGHGFR
ncbi:hypothetical protein ACFLTS_01620 [Chloroflexota bacterium]